MISREKKKSRLEMSTTPNDDQEVLGRLFGGKVCSPGPIWYIGPALLATVAFWILASLEGQIWLKAVIFFILVLAMDVFFTNWRRTHSSCPES